MDVEKASSTVLFCFQHCRKDINVICFSLPKSCPVCENDIGNSRLLVPLYRLPNPFSGAELSPHCLLIKPTKGSFLHDYSIEKDLHVGVTDSKCTIYHFSHHGLTRSFDGWSDCISINIMDLLPSQKRFQISGLWDSRLWEAVMSEEWIPKRYEEHLNNCYTFVLSFLGDLGIEEFLPSIRDKTNFCEEVVMKTIKRAFGYINIYRNLRLNKVYWTKNRDSADGENVRRGNDEVALVRKIKQSQ